MALDTSSSTKTAPATEGAADEHEFDPSGVDASTPLPPVALEADALEPDAGPPDAGSPDIGSNEGPREASSDDKSHSS